MPESTKPFYMELLVRSAGVHYDGDSRPDEGHIYVPVYYMWQEGPDDQHFQFEPGGDNCVPLMSDGDYAIPAQGKTFIDDAEGISVAEVFAEKKSEAIAVGKLLAAAPELLIMLKALLAEVDADNGETVVNSRWSSVHNLIAEAEGRAE